MGSIERMHSPAVEKLLAKWIYIGVPVVSLTVTGFMNYDPVNVGKMLVAVGVGLTALSLVFYSGILKFGRNHKALSVAVIVFLVAALISTITSAAPIEQSLFGVSGRNTGLITYLGLAGILIGAASIRNSTNFLKIGRGLVFAGLANVVLSGLELMGINIFGFNNIYGNILGTFGNPNFISSFLGIFITAYLAIIVGPGIPTWIKATSPIVISIAFYEIVTSNSIQGIVVTALGFGIVGFFLVKSYLKRVIFQLIYLAFSAVAGGFAVAGALQIGPLAQYIYKTSVSLRGEYWRAGIKMGMENPLTGVGLDSYGDWYRRTRSATAMVLPGPNTVTNSAHNVNIDIFASGGFPLILAYAFIIMIAIVSIFKVLSRTSGYDRIFYPLAAAWICYQAQAIISINQIGLAVWGWALTGAVIGYEYATRESSVGASDSKTNDSNKAKRYKDQSGGIYLTSVGGLTLGIIISISPLISDSTWRNSFINPSVESIVNASTQWPIDTVRLAQAAVLLEQNKYPQQAYELTKKLIEYNPNFFDGWKIMAGISQSSVEEKSEAIRRMQELDPRNEELK